MKLSTLELCNFRQFYGEQVLNFASGSAEGKNITVIHGFNGSGKTALLNAFIWCLYGETTPDLEASDRLLNERALAETPIGDTVPCRVALVFEYRNEEFRVERASDVVKKGHTEVSKLKPSLLLTRRSSSGETEQVGRDEGSRQHRVEQMLPRSLYPFFFFNGERVEALAREDAYEQVESGVKTLLDIEIYERGSRHLKDVTKALAVDAKQGGDKQLYDAMETVNQREQAKERLQERIEEEQQAIRSLNAEIARNEQEQEQIKSLAEEANRRKQLKDEEKGLRSDLALANRQMAALISKSGYLSFAPGVLDATERQVTEARKRGDIPAKIKPQFVDDLLESGICVCGRPLLVDSAEVLKLRSWRESTGLAELEEKILHVSADIRSLRERRRSMFEQLDGSLGQIVTLSKKLRECIDEIRAIDERITDGDFGERAAKIQELIKARGSEISSRKATILRYKEKIEEIDIEIVEIGKQIEKLEALTEKSALAKRQNTAVQHVVEALTAIGVILKEDVRQALDEQIREIWRRAAIKDYEASVGSNYQLMLTKMVGGVRQPVAGASTGEKQVLALSFVGALVRKARQNVGRNSDLDVETGGHFPLVMDSAFGSLEDDYRRAVAEWLPNLANQVVVMASKTQWRDEVETAMRPRIGREYILELHSPKKDSDRTIKIGNDELPYVVENPDSTEKTIIREV